MARDTDKRIELSDQLFAHMQLAIKTSFHAHSDRILLGNLTLTQY